MGLEKIDEFKKERGLTNEELAKMSGIPKATIDKITAGTTKDPKLETIKALVHCLGHTLDDLDDGIKKASNPENPALEANNDRMSSEDEQLYYDILDALIRGGLLKPGEKLSHNKADGLIAVLRLLRVIFDDSDKE